jgi:selenocysteine-specific elongation factor
MKSIVVGTAGHIDHGKSALVRALTGTDPDRLKEEKARGITIDLGFARTTIDDINFAFVDVPGHERFVKNMLAGVGGIDLVLFVVAADESVMPQSREHFDICRLLRVPTGIVAVTKTDLADSDTLELVKAEVGDLVAGSFLESAPVVAVSAKTGQGLDALRAALVAAAGVVGGRDTNRPARLPIDRVFSMKGFGTVVTGTLVSGRIAVDEELSALPGSRTVKVRGLQVHGARRSDAVAGERTAVNLSGAEVDELQRGQSLVPHNSYEETRIVDADVELLPTAKPLVDGTRVRFHQGTAEILARVAIVGPSKTSKPALPPGSVGFVQLRLETPAILARGDRYILRAYSPPITIAGGMILDPHPVKLPIRSQDALDRCRRLGFDPVPVMIEDMVGMGLGVSALASRAGINPREAEATIERLIREGRVVRAGDVLVTAAVVEALKTGVRNALAEHHRSNPLSDGIPREELRERLSTRAHPAIFDRALSDLAAAGTIVVRDRVALADHRVALSPEEQQARAIIERAFRDAGLKPPEPGAIAPSVKPAVADRMLKLLQRQKVLVKVDTLIFHDDTLKQLKADVAALKTSAPNAARLDVATFKEKFGVTRKFAIPLLEYLDRERVTRRVGDVRIVL